MRRLFALIAGVVLCGAVGCEQSVTGPRPFSVTVTASAASAAVGDSVTFTASAQGSNLIQLSADYGDGTVESHDIQAAQTATVRFKHAFTAAGTYTVVISATDATAGTKTASVVDFPIS